MKRVFFYAILVLGILMTTSTVLAKGKDYVVVIKKELTKDSDWQPVYKELADFYKAPVVTYEQSINEVEKILRKYNPRYVAVVAKPEIVNRDLVVDLHRLSRRIDSDIYADFIWGIITGYDASVAMRIVKQSQKDFTVKSALSTTSEVASGVWFDQFAWLDDGTKGVWGEKGISDTKPTSYTVEPYRLLGIFYEKMKELDPDLILSSSHATQYNLEMPFSTGNIYCKNGRLYANFFKPAYLPETNKPRIYAPIGNCLIGDINNSDQTMAVAWISSGGATAMGGYVLSTWHGRNGWGGLKYWVTAPGIHTYSEANYLNQQDMITQLYRRHPKLVEMMPDIATLGDEVRGAIEQDLKQLLDSVSKDDIGFMYDRDILAQYGDPKWNAKLQYKPELTGYSVKFERGKGTYTVVIETNQHYTNDKVRGKGFKEVHVLDIPIGFYFPERLNNPQLADNQSWDAVVNEDFILLYNVDLKPNQEYKIVLETE